MIYRLLHIFSKYLLVITVLLLVSCGLFSTREPELPNTRKSTFIPPTSPSIVISNLSYSISEKNVDNYIACFDDGTDIMKRKYSFIPSADVYAIYSSLFLNWDLLSERTYFKTLINSLEKDGKFELKLSNQKFDILSPDSSVFTCNYFLTANHTISGLPQNVNGILQFVFYPKNNGLWSIVSWNDIKSSGDSIPFSWSYLKAKLSN